MLILDLFVGLSHRAWLAVTILLGFILFTKLLARELNSLHCDGRGAEDPGQPPMAAALIRITPTHTF